MKKFMRKTIAISTAVLMIAGTGAAAFAADAAADADLNVTESLKSPVIALNVPTALGVALDPYGIATAGLAGQAVTVSGDKDVFILNRSSAPVRVTLNLKVKLAGDAVYNLDATQIDPTATNVSTKRISLGLIPASNLTLNTGTTDTVGTAGAGFASATELVGTDAFSFPATTPVTTLATAAHYRPFRILGSVGEGKEAQGAISFALDKAGYNAAGTALLTAPFGAANADAVVAAKKAAASFRIYGRLDVDTNKTAWAASDIEVSGKYILRPLVSDTYNAINNTGKVANTQNMITPATGFVGEAPTAATLSFKTGAATTNISVPFYAAGGVTATSLTYNNGTTTAAAPTGSYVLNANGFFLLKSAGSTFATIATGAYTATLTLSDGSTYDFGFTVTS
jgi:hypothetical protein